MPQKLDQRIVNTLIKGLITEAGELTFPENASVDELNCALSRDGSRSRRLGLEYENGAMDSSFTVSSSEVFQVGEWRNAGNLANTNFMVVQHGSALSFYNSSTAPYSDQEESFSIDLTNVQIAGKLAADYRCQFTSLQGLLVVVSEAINPFYITYDTATQSVSTFFINFKVRDFDWQSDVTKLTSDISSTSVTEERKYDTFNAGWSGVGEDALDEFIRERRAYPPLTFPWYAAKEADEKFSLKNFLSIDGGTSVYGNGRAILDFFYKDRSAVSGVNSLPVEIETSRFKTTAAFAGRVWYSGLSSGQNSGKVLYSAVVESVANEGDYSPLGQCHQINDPTSEFFSDLLDTDGGVINIIEASNIRKLYAYNQFLFVFAENGVWIISGIDDRFSPGSYYVSKITNVGLYSENSFVAAEGIPFWWSKTGIHTFNFDQTSGYPIEQNVSISTIQTFWDEIEVNAKNKVKASYDPINKRVFWLYPENGETLQNKYRKILILDIPLQAFYPWEVADNDDYVMDLFFFDGYGNSMFNVDVVDSTGAVVTTDGTTAVQVPETNLLLTADTQLSAIVFNSATSKMSVALFSSKSFLDWGTDNYSSFVETGYDFIGDLVLKKTAPYIVVYCRSTEEGYTGNSTTGYTAINPSSLILKSYWDFKTQESSSQQAYRIKPFNLVNTSDLTDTNQVSTMVITRLKVRGRGRSMRLRFESEQGKNFVLLGYGVIVGANQRF